MPVKNNHGIKISYEVIGSGEPLVLITGIGYGAWFWKTIAKQLAKWYQVIVYDNRGAGASAKPDGPYTISMMTDDVVGLVSQLGYKRLHVCGHSLGGFIAQEFAITRPEMVDKLILASTNHGGRNIVPIDPVALKAILNREGDPREVIESGIRIAAYTDFETRKPEIFADIVAYRMTVPVAPEYYQAQVAAGIAMSTFSDEQIDMRMQAIRARTLVVCGESDLVVPVGNADLLVETIAQAEKSIIPKTGHIFPLEDPESTTAVLRSFLG